MGWLDAYLDHAGKAPFSLQAILPRVGRALVCNWWKGNRQRPMVVNEHFCMSLAKRIGLPAAEIIALPGRLLVERCFDSVVSQSRSGEIPG